MSGAEAMFKLVWVLICCIAHIFQICHKQNLFMHYRAFHSLTNNGIEEEKKKKIAEKQHDIVTKFREVGVGTRKKKEILFDVQYVYVSLKSITSYLVLPYNHIKCSSL